MKLFHSRSRLILQKNFFSQRVVFHWNRLSQHFVEAMSVNWFKLRIDRHWKRYGRLKTRDLHSPSSFKLCGVITTYTPIADCYDEMIAVASLLVVVPRRSHVVTKGSFFSDLWCTSLADRTATQYDRLLAAACCPSVRLSVVCLSVTLCIVALRVGVRG